MRRIIAIGDLHGSIDVLLELVEEMGLVGPGFDLEMQSTDLVFIGDLCDRGYNSRDIYDSVIRWRAQAPAQDSTVRLILGNHEVMNVFGQRAYNTAEEYLSFDSSSVAAGKRAHMAAFAPGGWLYRFLVTQAFAVKLGGIVFAHGDLPMALAAARVEEIDEGAMDALRESERSGRTRGLPDALFEPAVSILWCRQAQVQRPRGYERALLSFLAKNGASAWVCGHTPAEDGRFHQAFSGRYLCIDTAMTFRRRGIGRPSALILDSGHAHAAYLDDRRLNFAEIDLAAVPPTAIP